MRCVFYMARSALPMRRPTCFHGQVRVAAHDIVYSCCYYYYDIHPAHETAHVSSQAGPGRGA